MRLCRVAPGSRGVRRPSAAPGPPTRSDPRRSASQPLIRPSRHVKKTDPVEPTHRDRHRPTHDPRGDAHAGPLERWKPSRCIQTPPRRRERSSELLPPDSLAGPACGLTRRRKTSAAITGRATPFYAPRRADQSKLTTRLSHGERRGRLPKDRATDRATLLLAEHGRSRPVVSPRRRP